MSTAEHMSGRRTEKKLRSSVHEMAANIIESIGELFGAQASKSDTHDEAEVEFGPEMDYE